MSRHTFHFMGDIRCRCERCHRYGRETEITVVIAEWTPATELEFEVDTAARMEGWDDHETCDECAREIERDIHECNQYQ